MKFKRFLYIGHLFLGLVFLLGSVGFAKDSEAVDKNAVLSELHLSDSSISKVEKEISKEFSKPKPEKQAIEGGG